MKRFYLLLGLLLSVATHSYAAVSFVISTSTFVTDTSLGTFVVGPSTFGAIIGIQYDIVATDGVTGNTCHRVYDFAVTPRLSFPTANAINNAIQADVTRRNPRAGMLACLAEKNAETTRAQPPVNANVPGVDGTSVTPP